MAHVGSWTPTYCPPSSCWISTLPRGAASRVQLGGDAPQTGVRRGRGARKALRGPAAVSRRRAAEEPSVPTLNPGHNEPVTSREAYGLHRPMTLLLRQLQELGLSPDSPPDL